MSAALLYDVKNDLVALRPVIWGGVNPTNPHLGGLDASVTSSKGLLNDIISVTLMVRAPPLGPRPALSFTQRAAVETKTLTSTDDVREEVLKTFGELVRKLSFKLYEYDPRRGFPYDPRFPECPLFDPPVLGGAVRELLLTLMHQPAVAVEPDSLYRTLAICSICGDQNRYMPSIREGHGSAWGGGNLGFAHLQCAPWLSELEERAETFAVGY